MSPTLSPTPGLCIIQPLPAPKTGLQLVSHKDVTKLLLGTVLAVGEPGYTKFGALIQPNCKVGDVVYFLSYDDVGGYDSFLVDNKKYYVVEHLDIRVVT